MTRPITNGDHHGSRATSLTAVLALALVSACALPSVSVAQTDTCPNAELRKGPGALLPDCRAYEQVSPTDKNGGDVVLNAAFADEVVKAFSVAADGERAMFAANTEFAGAEYGGTALVTPYASQRTHKGWTTQAVSSSVTPPGAGVLVAMSASDLRRTFLTSSGVLRTDPPHTDPGFFNVYMRDNFSGVINPFISITPAPGNYHFLAPATTADANRIVFAADAQLTNDPMPSDPGFPDFKVYERFGGETRLVSIRPDGTPFNHASPGRTWTFYGTSSSTRGAVSSDGAHIFFSGSDAPADPEELFRRSNGATTVAASPSRRSPVDPEGVRTKTFRLGSADGGRVVFTSSELLTDDANTGPLREGTDLYRYDVDADELIDISATAGGDGARVEGVLGADEAARRIYYVAFGQVVPGEGSSSGTEPNLYLWEDDGTADGTTRFIATLSTADGSNWNDLNGNWTARVTGDGGTLVFQSDASIPGFDNGGARQVYHYDANAVGGTGRLSCVSCNPNGSTPLGAGSIPTNQAESMTQPWEHPHALSDDGRRVFFNTRDALVPRDSNGVNDPYMWEGGRLNLLSTGTSERPSYFYNASESGDDAFILTAEALAPQDVDDLTDLYDVRVGGGFAPPTPVATCADDECQGGDAVGPSAGPIGSTRLRDTRDVSPRLRLVLSLRAPSRAQRARLARGRKIGVRVRVSRAARVRVVVRGRTASGSRVVASGTARSRRAGTVVVRLGMNRLAQRRLRRAGAMRLSFQARAAGARSRSLNLRLRETR